MQEYFLFGAMILTLSVFFFLSFFKSLSVYLLRSELKKLDTSAKVLTVASATVYELLIKPTTLDTRVDCPFVDD